MWDSREIPAMGGPPYEPPIDEGMGLSVTIRRVLALTLLEKQWTQPVLSSRDQETNSGEKENLIRSSKKDKLLPAHTPLRSACSGDRLPQRRSAAPRLSHWEATYL